MINKINIQIPNSLNIKEFELEFNNLTYDIYYETFNKDLHISFLECIKSGGGITRAFAHRLLYSMVKTCDENIVPFRDFLFGLDDNINDFTGDKGWGSVFSEFVLESFGNSVLRVTKNELSKN